MKPQKLVVVGHGMVAHRLVETLRERDLDGAWQVVAIGEERLPAYDRVSLSSYVGGWDASALSMVPEGFYGDDELLLDDAVTSIDRVAKVVVTRRGSLVPYDVLVLATGSRAFVPPVPGHDLERVEVYRTIDDLDAIRTHAQGASTGAVIGGGLLGLEAANALDSLGLKTHVVEAAPRLMPLQVDEGGGAVLARRIRELGLVVHTGAMLDHIEETDDGGRRLCFKDGASIDVDVVVFSAGIRARDELAEPAGLERGPRGGFLVDATCRTQDPSIYAIGECASVEGVAYGLVAPGYGQARVVVDRVLGGDAAFETPDMSTKLKLLGVEVASFGDALAATPGALELVWADHVAGIYKKLVVSDDAATLLGGVLVGDSSGYDLAKPLVGTQVGEALPSLILPSSSADGPQIAIPDSAQICSCNAVTRGEVLCAIKEHDATTIPAIKACTRAGTTCGSCVPALTRLLTEAGVEKDPALCEHFRMSRQDLYEVIRITGLRTFSDVIAGHGSGAGCDICKPSVASILAGLHQEHVLADEHAGAQDTNDHAMANMQKDGSYSVIPRIPGGEITPERLIALGEVARDFKLYTKITGGQRIDMFGARLDQLPAIWTRLVDAGFETGQGYGKALRTVKSCVGSTWCRYGVQDSVKMAIDLELRYRGLRSPHKIKGGVSGCARECAEARGKDFGVIATEKGWNLYVGGNGGFTPRHAELLAGDLDDDTLVRTIDRFLVYYLRTADRLQRTAVWIEAMDGGLDHLRSVIIDDSLGVCAELDAAMARHVEAYRDEWAATLEDPAKLKRFVPFVNAPREVDQDIVFVSERDQHRPATPEERRVLVGGPTLPVRAR